jgi:hypothetical protein
MSRIFFLLFCVSITASVNSQTITGNLRLLTNQTIKLEGFDGLKTYPISSTNIDENANFKLNYSKADEGVGYLMTADNKTLFVILSGENIELVGNLSTRFAFFSSENSCKGNC